MDDPGRLSSSPDVPSLPLSEHADRRGPEFRPTETFSEKFRRIPACRDRTPILSLKHFEQNEPLVRWMFRRMPVCRDQTQILSLSLSLYVCVFHHRS